MKNVFFDEAQYWLRTLLANLKYAARLFLKFSKCLDLLYAIQGVMSYGDNNLFFSNEGENKPFLL